MGHTHVGWLQTNPEMVTLAVNGILKVLSDLVTLNE